MTSNDPQAERVLVRRHCILCNTPSTVEVPRHVLEALNRGEFVQHAWPEGTPGQREVLISGTHEVCFEAEFPPEEGSPEEIPQEEP